jgi:ABC-type Fe3+/spermidine/putrescine transport system ATPase subunit
MIRSALGDVHGVAAAETGSSSRAVALIRPEHCIVATSLPPMELNVWQGTLEEIVYAGEHSEYLVDCGGTPVKAWRTAAEEPAMGETVWVSARPANVRILPDE